LSFGAGDSTSLSVPFGCVITCWHLVVKEKMLSVLFRTALFVDGSLVVESRRKIQIFCWEYDEEVTNTHFRNCSELIGLEKIFRNANGCLASDGVQQRPKFSTSQVVQTSHAVKGLISAGGTATLEFKRLFSQRDPTNECFCSSRSQ